jgi:hypothetical protein
LVFKGTLTGGLIGAAVATITAGILITTGIATVAAGTPTIIGVSAFALFGFLYGARIGNFILGGSNTPKKPEARPVDAQDIVNAVNIAFAQGVTVGHEMTVANPKEAQAESRNFRKLVTEQQNATAQNQTR